MCSVHQLWLFQRLASLLNIYPFHDIRVDIRRGCSGYSTDWADSSLANDIVCQGTETLWVVKNLVLLWMITRTSIIQLTCDILSGTLLDDLIVWSGWVHPVDFGLQLRSLSLLLLSDDLLAVSTTFEKRSQLIADSRLSLTNLMAIVIWERSNIRSCSLTDFIWIL